MHCHKERSIFHGDKEELKARIEAAEEDLGFFSLYWDEIRKSGFATEKELEQGINDALDDLINAKDKLNENGTPP